MIPTCVNNMYMHTYMHIMTDSISFWYNGRGADNTSVGNLVCPNNQILKLVQAVKSFTPMCLVAI